MVDLVGQISFTSASWLRVIQSVPTGFIFIPATMAAYIGLPQEKSNAVAGLVNFMRNIGSGVVDIVGSYDVQSKSLAERVGFEPTIPVKVYTLSKRAPSATRPSLRHEGSPIIADCRSPVAAAGPFGPSHRLFAVEFARSADAVAVSRQHGIELAQKPWHWRDRHDDSSQKGHRHAQENFSKRVRAGVRPAIGINQMHCLLALFELQMGEEVQQLVCLVGHGVKFMEEVETMQPFEISGANAACAVVDHYGLGGLFHST